jgi:hypothetical protein
MRIEVVTTMNAKGWHELGGRMVRAFKRCWPADVKLIVYAEGFTVSEPGVESRNLPKWLDEFKGRHKNNRRANGHTPSRYDFLYDAVKFSHKVAAITDAGLAQTDGVMIWLDADTYTHASVTHVWLEGLFPEPSYIAWLDRRNSLPETGFIMFRCGHPAHQAAMTAFRRLYLTDDIFGIGQTSDNSALRHVIDRMVKGGEIEPPVSLSGDDKNWSHPFVNGPLGACMDHMKGNRKRRKRSDKWDVRTPRKEAYWELG